VIRRLVALAVLVLALPSTAAHAAEGACGRFRPGHAVGTVQGEGVTELSGVAASTRYDDVLWVHDDSGGQPVVDAIDEAGARLGTYRLAGATATDWEDIAAADGHLYVGDIGDNLKARKEVVVYRVDEPSTRPDGTGGTLGTATFHLTYPTGPTDAEALVVDRQTGDLYVVTKQWDGPYARVFRAPAASLVDGAHVELAQVARFDIPAARSTALGLPGTLVTGADVSPDDRTVLVRTYRAVLAFARPAGQPLAAAFEATPCEVPQVEEAQGEAVAWVGDDAYVTISEGEHPVVNRFDAVPAPATTTTTTKAASEEAAGGSSDVPLVALLAVVVAVGALVAVLSLRRRAGRPRTPGSPRP
jgi:hypothetical protein